MRYFSIGLDSESACSLCEHKWSSSKVRRMLMSPFKAPSKSFFLLIVRCWFCPQPLTASKIYISLIIDILVCRLSWLFPAVTPPSHLYISCLSYPCNFYCYLIVLAHLHNLRAILFWSSGTVLVFLWIDSDSRFDSIRTFRFAEKANHNSERTKYLQQIRLWIDWTSTEQRDSTPFDMKVLCSFSPEIIINVVFCKWYSSDSAQIATSSIKFSIR